MYTLIEGDASEELKKLHSSSVDLIVTSPPYWNLKNYTNSNKEIGSGQSLDEYYISLMHVWLNCIRVLKPGCRMVINIGDQFIRSTSETDYQVLPHHAKITTQLTDIGMMYMGLIIWQKVTRSKTNGGAKIIGSVDRPRTAHHLINHEYILIFTKPGKGHVPQGTLHESKIDIELRRKWFTDHWFIPNTDENEHQASFPLDIPSRLIRMYSYVGETVLDPFVGSGTTLAAAAFHDRKSIGIDLGWSNNWQDLVHQRMKQVEYDKELWQETLAERALDEQECRREF